MAFKDNDINEFWVDNFMENHHVKNEYEGVEILPAEKIVRMFAESGWVKSLLVVGMTDVLTAFQATGSFIVDGTRSVGSILREPTPPFKESAWGINGVICSKGAGILRQLFNSGAYPPPKTLLDFRNIQAPFIDCMGILPILPVCNPVNP